MHGDLLGVVISVALIGFGFILQALFKKKDEELARKILHSWVGNWFFIYKYFFTSSTLAMLGLFVFAGINLLLEIFWQRTHRYGTVYYPLSIIVLLCFLDGGYGTMQALGCGILVMAYGDSMAALVGRKIKSPYMPYLYDKTLAGSITMFVVSAAVLYLFGVSVGMSLLIGFAAAVMEAYSPFGLDNIFVPMVVFILVSKLC